MKLRWSGDDQLLLGKTALDCLRYHCHRDHSIVGQKGDIDGVMKRIAETFQLDSSYMLLSTLEERAEAFVNTALVQGILVKI